MGVPVSRACASAASSQGCQCTGLPACWRRYGLEASSSRLPSLHASANVKTRSPAGAGLPDVQRQAASMRRRSRIAGPDVLAEEGKDHVPEFLVVIFAREAMQLLGLRQPFVGFASLVEVCT